jgi:hypothetical protein
MSISQADKMSIYKLLAFYGLGLVVIILFNNTPSFKSGVCGPNFDFVSAFLYFVVSVVLLMKSVIDTIRNKDKKYLLLTNVTVIALLFLSLWISGFFAK